MFLKEEWSNIMANTLISIAFVIVCVFLTVVVLMQEGKTRGLGTIGGIADSYWGKNKGRSVEGTLENMTKAAAVLFMVLAFVLNIVK